MKKEFKTLSAMYQSRDFNMFIGNKLGNDSERAERIQEYAENGCNGSMHSEIIEDWRDYLSTLKVFEPGVDEIDDIENFDISERK